VLAGRDRGRLDELQAAFGGAGVPLVADPLDPKQVRLEAAAAWHLSGPAAAGQAAAPAVRAQAGVGTRVPRPGWTGRPGSGAPWRGSPRLHPPIKPPKRRHARALPAPWQAEAAFAEVVSSHGRIDGVANCVGSIVLKSAHTTSDADFEQARAAWRAGRRRAGRPAGAARSPRSGHSTARRGAAARACGRGQLRSRHPLTRSASLRAPWPTANPQTLRVNLFSCFNILRPAVKAMMKQQPGGGSVAFCSSAVARHGIPNHEAIAAAKAGVQGLMLSAAATYAPKNIRWAGRVLDRNGGTGRVAGGSCASSQAPLFAGRLRPPLCAGMPGATKPPRARPRPLAASTASPPG
jgi:NAD(P)-dependent dehydrogenase (short-subunit alcohol dehydrogenase family)